MNISNIIKKLWTSSPSEIVFLFKNRLYKESNWNYSLKQIVKSKKHMNTQYLIDRWERYWRIIENHNHDDGSKKYFEFQNKAIFELGCGPLFGWGPIALFKGANIYYYYDPSLIRQVVESTEIKEKYFNPLYKELLSNFGNTMSFNEFYRKIMAKCISVDFSKKEFVDLILSNSVLEHIPRNDIQTMLSKLFFICKNKGYFLHSVDFGSHEFGTKGFGSLYTRDLNKELKNLNLLRMSDIEKYLIESGFQLLHNTIYHSQKVSRDSLNPTWKKYLDKDLTSRVVFFVGKKLN